MSKPFAPSYSQLRGGYGGFSGVYVATRHPLHLALVAGKQAPEQIKEQGTDMNWQASRQKAQKSCRNAISNVRRPDKRGGQVHAMAVGWHMEHGPRSPKLHNVLGFTQLGAYKIQVVACCLE